MKITKAKLMVPSQGSTFLHKKCPTVHSTVSLTSLFLSAIYLSDLVCPENLNEVSVGKKLHS